MKKYITRPYTCNKISKEIIAALFISHLASPVTVAAFAKSATARARRRFGGVEIAAGRIDTEGPETGAVQSNQTEACADSSGTSSLGDTLAEFVALELYESFYPEAGDDEQLATAVKVMQSAAYDLQAIAHALANIGRERMSAKAVARPLFRQGGARMDRDHVRLLLERLRRCVHRR